MSVIAEQAARRRTFAIISHPDAGKTNHTEKQKHNSSTKQKTDTEKGRKAARHATSDWMELEKRRGISVTTSVMQFPYKDVVINLLDTPGHEDFSEDTYRTVTAVDSALMVIDSAKGGEERTIKLMEVCRLRDTPIISFINKLDREGREPVELLDEIESILKIQCAPITWPIGMGKGFKGVFNLYTDSIHLFSPTHGGRIQEGEVIAGLANPRLDELFGSMIAELRDEVELVKGASHAFDIEAYRAGKLTPVFFGSAVNNFGVEDLLYALVVFVLLVLSRVFFSFVVRPEEERFSGYVYKIQANMDPAHRDRVAFLRVCSVAYTKGGKFYHVRLGREVKIANAITFMAREREHVEDAYPGDIIGLHNHGTIQLGDTFTEGETLKFTGIPHFAPELFRRARLRDPLRMKALQKGLEQMCDEGATHFFRPLNSKDIKLGAVGKLQIDVIAQRLQDEYGVECLFEPVAVATARWVMCDDAKRLEEFRRKAHDNLALDIAGDLAYLSPTRIYLDLTMERWPGIDFVATREH